MNASTEEWVRKAEADLKGARELQKAAAPELHDLICFHCQQVAEKYLKALLQELGLPVPRTHVLEDLFDRLLPHDSTLRGMRRRLASLSQFAVDYRYPDMSGTTRQAKAALRASEHVREKLRHRLGIKP